MKSPLTTLLHHLNLLEKYIIELTAHQADHCTEFLDCNSGFRDLENIVINNRREIRQLREVVSNLKQELVRDAKSIENLEKSVKSLNIKLKNYAKREKLIIKNFKLLTNMVKNLKPNN